VIGRWSAAVAGSLLALPVAAQQPQVNAGEALQLLQKVATAAQKVNYTGVFVYRGSGQDETSRITHVIDGSDEYERLEVLDGSPREVLRRNDEVRCFLPENKLLIVERRNARQLFPTLLPGSLAGLTEYYRIRMAGPARIAGIESQSVQIEPRDEYRYAHRFWIDPHSGLLLKASLLDESSRPLESFAFTELKIGGGFDREQLKAQFAVKNGDWQVQQVKSSDARVDDSQWLFRAIPPGFRRVSAARRQLRADAPESVQLIFSDGLAAMSVFIEPAAGRKKEDGFFTMGAVNGYRRSLGDQQIVTMGDVPPAALRRFADNIELRKK
jgi:sigma-E factor negative regulatory protein RseB